MRFSGNKLLFLFCLSFFFLGCGTKEPTAVLPPVPTNTPTVVDEPTSVPVSTATPRPTDTPTVVPTATPEPTNTPVPTPTPEPTNMPTPTTVPSNGKTIYLTFDDGPSYLTEDLLSLLEKYNTKATFFMCDTGRPKLIKKVHEAGHAIGVHTKTHLYNEIYQSEEAYFEDLYAMQNIIYEQTGERSMLMRFPGGSSNGVSSFNPGIMTRLSKLVEEKGFTYFDWNVSSGDTSTQDTEQILNTLITETKELTHAIVLLHSEARDFSFNAIEDYLLWGLDNGYTFLPLTADSPRALHRIRN